MRRLKFGLVFLIFGVAIAYLVHLARLVDSGYCFAAEKYLTEEEKIRVALVDLLKKYPPPVIRTPVEPRVSSLSAPKNPIHYRDVDEFLSLNPDCCKVESAELSMEGGKLTLLEKLTGTATDIVVVNYLVRYRDDDNTERAIKTLESLRITSCGSRGTPWQP